MACDTITAARQITSGRAKLDSIVALPLWQRGANLRVALHELVLGARDDKPATLALCQLWLGTSGDGLTSSNRHIYNLFKSE